MKSKFNESKDPVYIGDEIVNSSRRIAILITIIISTLVLKGSFSPQEAASRLSEILTKCVSTEQSETGSIEILPLLEALEGCNLELRGLNGAKENATVAPPSDFNEKEVQEPEDTELEAPKTDTQSIFPDIKKS